MRQMFSILIVLLAIGLEESCAQNTSVDLEYRINPIYSRGFRQPLYDGDRAGFFTMHRTRLILNYNDSDSLRAELILQDRRAWGEVNERQDVAEIAIFRAWVEKKLGSNFFVKLGRQGLVYDDQHLFGGLNWGGTLAHDLALGKYETQSFEAHLGLAFNSNRINELKRELFLQNFYKNMQFLRLHKRWKKAKSTIWFVNHGLEKADTTVAYTQTFGTNTSVQLTPKVKVTGVYLKQVGRNSSNRKVNASFLSALLLYKVTNKLSLSFALDRMSGSDVRSLNDPEAKSSTYSILYGLRHGRFGFIDYFYLLIEPVSGLQDFYFLLDFSLSKKINIKNYVHYFATDANTYATTDQAFSDPLDSFLGIENDFQVSYNVSKDFKASLVHAIMFGSDTLDEMFGGTPSRENQAFYLVITASPRIFEKNSN